MFVSHRLRRIIDAGHQHGHQRGHDATCHAVRYRDLETVDQHLAAREGLQRGSVGRVVMDAAAVKRHLRLQAAEAIHRHDIQHVQPVDIAVVGQQLPRGERQRRILVRREKVLQLDRARQEAAAIQDVEVNQAVARRQHIHRIESRRQHLGQRVGRRHQRRELVERSRVGGRDRRVVETSDDDIHRADAAGSMAVFNGIPETIGVQFILRQAIEKGRDRGVVDQVILADLVAQGQADAGAHVGRDPVAILFVQHHPEPFDGMVVDIVARDRETILVQHRDFVVAVVGDIAAIVGDHPIAAGHSVAGGQHADGREAGDAAVPADGMDRVHDPRHPQILPGVVGVDIVVVIQKVLRRHPRRRRGFTREGERRPGQFRPDHDAQHATLRDVGDDVATGGRRVVDANDPDGDDRLAACGGQPRQHSLPETGNDRDAGVGDRDGETVAVQHGDVEGAVVGRARGAADRHLIAIVQTVVGRGDNGGRDAADSIGGDGRRTDIDDFVVEGIDDFHFHRKSPQRIGQARIVEQVRAAQGRRVRRHGHQRSQRRIGGGAIAYAGIADAADIDDRQAVVAVTVEIVRQHRQFRNPIGQHAQNIIYRQRFGIVLTEGRAAGIGARR